MLIGGLRADSEASSWQRTGSTPLGRKYFCWSGQPGDRIFDCSTKALGTPGPRAGDPREMDPSAVCLLRISGRIQKSLRSRWGLAPCNQSIASGFGAGEIKSGF
jgi:hypothetical protein